MTVDREAMVDFVAEGFGTPGNDTPLNPAYRFYADAPLKAAGHRRGQEAARRGRPREGAGSHPDRFRPAGVRTQLAVAIREMAKAAGFDINVQTMPHATYLDQVWKKGSFYIGFYNMQPTADGIFSLLYTSNAAWNETRWNNAEFDSVIAEARTTVDEAEAQALYGSGAEADARPRCRRSSRCSSTCSRASATMSRAISSIRAAPSSGSTMSRWATARRNAADSYRQTGAGDSACLSAIFCSASADGLHAVRRVDSSSSASHRSCPPTRPS